MKINYGKVLMWSAIIVSMPRWAGAFISADVSNIPNWVNEALHYGNLIAGFGMGFLEVLAAAYMLDAWGKMKPKASWNAKSYDHKWKILTGFIIGLFILMPLILAPYIVSRMTGVSIATALNYVAVQYIWSIAVVLSPAFIVGGVSVASGELVENETKSEPRKESKPKTKKKKEVASEQVQITASAGTSNRLPGDFRLLTNEHKNIIANSSTSKLTELANISDSTARRWKRQVAANGYHK